MIPSLTSQNISSLSSSFFEDVEKLKKTFSFENEENEKLFYKKNSYLFATTSASLFRLLPQIPFFKHKAIFEKLLYNLQLLTLEEKYVELFNKNSEVNDIENTLNKAQNGKPFLFCCFHTGAYSFIPALLANQSLDFGFLANKTLTKKKGELFIKAHHNYCQQNNLTSTIQIIDVEESRGIWQAIRMLKEGKSLVIYADGNTGVSYSTVKDKQKENQNTVKVNFLGENLRVRQGIAFLSYACSVPIIPIISNRENPTDSYNLKTNYTILPAINPPLLEKDSIKKTISKENFAQQTMQKLYSILEKEVCKNNIERVDQWEGWIFVNKFFEELHKPLFLEKEVIFNKNKPFQEKINEHYIFNEERFAVINKTENQPKTLFDKFTYRFFPVSDLLYEVITYFSIPKKLYLSNYEDKQKENSSHSPISTNFILDSQLQLSKTPIPIGALEKLIEKNILIQYT